MFPLGHCSYTDRSFCEQPPMVLGNQAKTNPLEFYLNKKRHPVCLFSLVNEVVEIFTIMFYLEGQ